MKKLLFILLLPVCHAGHAQYIISTVAGSGTAGFSGNNVSALTAKLDWPTGVAVDAAGNMFIADMGNNVVRKVNTAGIITTIAGIGTGAGTGVGLDGTGTGGYTGDGGAATAATLYSPNGVAVDATGNVYIADNGNNVVRKVSTAGIITTIAGGGTYTMEGMAATTANLFGPTDVAVDAAGNVYVADNGHGYVYKVDAAGLIHTVAGNGISGNSGDGGPATDANLNPTSIKVDAAGNLYIADGLDAFVRKVNSAGIISTLAGNGSYGYGGDGGPGTAATLNNGPMGIAVDAAGNVYISDVNNERIRKISTAGIITTFAGITLQGFSGDGGPATSAQLRGPQGLATDPAGNVYVADWGNNRIRKVHIHSAYVNNANQQPDINVYPNPTNNELNIDGITQKTDYSLFDFTGVRLLQGSIDQASNKLSVQKLATGVYILELNCEDGARYIRKIIRE